MFTLLGEPGNGDGRKPAWTLIYGHPFVRIWQRFFCLAYLFYNMSIFYTI